MTNTHRLRFAVLAAALSSDAREATVQAQRLGFAGLLFDAFSVALDLTTLSGTGRREFRHVLSSQNRELVGLRIDLGNKGFGPGADIDRLLDQSKQVFEAAAGLLAPLVCVELGPLPEPAADVKPKPKVTQEQAGLILLPTFEPAPEVVSETIPAKLDQVFAASVDSAMTELGKLADRYNITVAFRSELASFAALERALTSARCPWFGVDLDPVGILRDPWEADEVFSSLGPHIRHVRGRDAVKGADRRTKPAAIGRGDTKWDITLNNLESASFHGWLTLDPMELADRPAGALAGLKYLKLH